MANREIKVTIVGDSTKAEQALKKTADAAERIGPAGKTAQGALDNVTNSLTNKLGPAAPIAQGALDKLGLTAGGLGTTLGVGVVAGAAAGGVALAKFALDGAHKFVELAGEVRNFQRASGASAEESSRFVAVLDDMGISADTGAGAVFKLGKAASTNADGLEKAGIAVARNLDGTSNLTETLLNAADAYKATTDPAKRTEIAFAAFGKQGKELIPVLEQGREGLKRFFEGAEENRQIFSQDDLDTAREYELAMDALGDAAGGLQRGLGKGLVPVLADMAQGTATAVSAVDKATEKVGGLGGIVKTVAGGISPLTSLVGELGGKSKDTADKQDEHADAAARVSAELQTQRERTEEQTRALDGLLQATAAQFNAELAHERSLNNLEDAQAKVLEATTGHTLAVQTHGPKSAEAKVAAEELSRAQLGERDAALQAAGAAVTMQEKQATANGETWTATQRHDALRVELSKVRDSLAPGSPLRAALDQYITRLGDVPSKIKTQIELDTAQAISDFRAMERQFANNPRATINPPARARGGDVKAGALYTVGEQGEEWFVPDEDGTIIPNDVVRAARQPGNGTARASQHSAGAAAPQSVSVNFTIQVSASPGVDHQALASTLVSTLNRDATGRLGKAVRDAMARSGDMGYPGMSFVNA